MTWDTAEQDFLPADDARGKLFDEILEQLAACDLFSNTALGQPTIFPVYAHDNEDVGTAHATCVHDFISWLRKIKAGILSDKSALPPLTSNDQDTSPQRNIIANQIRLLRIGDVRPDEAIPCIDKVIVCGSEVLERYCRTPYASKYIDEVVNICKRNESLSMKILKSRIEDFAHGETGKDEHHHVLTEIAFLSVRKSRMPERHGMIPVSLDGNHHLPYLSVFEDSDITFKLKSTSSASKHALFFQLLEQLFVEHKDLANDFRNYYNKVVEELNLSVNGNADVSRTYFQNCLNSNMTKMYYKHWDTFTTAMRNGRFHEYGGMLGRQVLEILDHVREEERRKTLQWISPMAAPPMPGKYHDGRAKRLDGTCDWVSKDAKFIQWYESETSEIVSLQGRMGMGKTHATSRVIEWIQRSLGEDQHDKALAHFYCIEQDEMRSTATAILRSIVRQIATKPRKGLALDEAIVKMWTKHAQKEQRYDTSTFDEWEDCLSELINKFHRATIVLDALDECKSAERTELTKLFTSLAERCSNLKIFVSTRPESDLSRWLDGRPSISMHNGCTSGDIAAFVQHKITQHSEWPEIDHELKKLILQTLVDKSQGLFLCAHLQIENLQECLYEDDIRDELETLPQRLTELYEKLYLRATIKRAEKKFRDRALRWVLCSLRPLTSDELLFAISQDAQSDRLAPTRRDVSEKLILKSCHNFLTLDSVNTERDYLYYGTGHPGVPVWRLAHQAVAEFFENSVSCTQERAEMHYEAGKLCLMISLNTFGGFSDEGRKMYDNRCPCRRGESSETSLDWANSHHSTLKGPLGEYASHAWPTHVRTHENQESHNGERLSQMLLRFLDDPKEGCLIYERWLEHEAAWGLPWSGVYQRRLHKMAQANKMSLISFLCYMGFPRTVAKFLNSTCLEKATHYVAHDWSPWESGWVRSSSVKSLRWSPVALACVHDEVKVLQCLLSSEPLARLETTITDEVPPIVAAARGDSVEVARELLRPHHDISMCSSFTSRHGHVLRFAICGDSMKVLPILLDRVLLNPPTLTGALSSVRRSDFISTRAISLLLERGVEVNEPLHDGTLLAVAAYMGEEGLVDELLNNGAEASTQFKCLDSGERWDGENALEYCLCNEKDTPHNSVARLLVKRGASVTARAVAIVGDQIRLKQHGWHLEELRRDILRLLITNISNPNEICKDRYGRPTCALEEAFRIASVADVKLLLDRGADPKLLGGGTISAAVWETLFNKIDGPYPTRQLIDFLDKVGVKFRNLEGGDLDIALAAAALTGLTAIGPNTYRGSHGF